MSSADTSPSPTHILIPRGANSPGMPSDVLYDLTVALSLATGSAAGLLALLTWESLRNSPFGRAVLVLSAVMVLFIGYHFLVLVSPAAPTYVSVFKSALFTGVAVFIWMLVLSQHRLRSRPDPGEAR